MGLQRPVVKGRRLLVYWRKREGEKAVRGFLVRPILRRRGQSKKRQACQPRLDSISATLLLSTSHQLLDRQLSPGYHRILQDTERRENSKPKKRPSTTHGIVGPVSERVALPHPPHVRPSPQSRIMSDTKPNGLGTRTSLRKTSINSTSDAPRTGKVPTVKRGTKRSADGATPVVDEEGVKQSLGVALDSDDEGDREGEFLGKRDQRRLLRVLTA
jgi:hypothetical protein